MTTEHYVQLVLLVAAVIVLAYLLSLYDIARMQRNAKKHSEQLRIIDILKK
jgi:hypothetical protein